MRPRRAGVSAFGISGTNAHVIVEEAPPVPGPGAGAVPGAGDATAGDGWGAWVVSGRSAGALRAQAGRLADYLAERPGPGVVPVGRALAGRTRFGCRAVLVGRDRAGLVPGLRALAAGRDWAGLVRGTAARPARTAFIFPGQGSQYPGMGRELAAAYPVFREALDEVCAELDGQLGRPLREVLFADEDDPAAPLLHQTAYTQPALFAVEVALAGLVGSWGLRPDFLLGHSIGELSAACVAGALSVRDASVLVAARARLVQDLPPGGAMIAVQASEEEITASLATTGGNLALGAVNGPYAVVVAGPEAPALALAARWAGRGRRTKRLTVSHAFHSPLLEPMLDGFAEVLGRVSIGTPSVPVVSNVTGEPLPAAEFSSPGYWGRHVRQPVRFYDGMRWLARAGVTCFLELGPGGVLAAHGPDCLAAVGSRGTVASALNNSAPEAAALHNAVTELHANGTPLDWTALLPGPASPPVPLPAYAFTRQRYWLDPPASPAAPVSSAGSGLFGLPEEPQDVTVVGLASAATTAAALDLVRAEVAAVAGHPSGESVPADQSFTELGLDSMAAVRLHKRLTAVTGLDLPVALLIDCPTPVALAAQLQALAAAASAAVESGPADADRSVDAPSPADPAVPDSAVAVGPARGPGPSPSPGPGPQPSPRPSVGRSASPGAGPGPDGLLTAALRQAHAVGALADMAPALAALSRLRSESGALDDRSRAGDAALITDGPAPSGLICVPSFMAGSGPHQFMRLASEFTPRPRTHGLMLPGFGPEDRLPATWRAAIDAMAETVRRVAGRDPFVLLGHSVGGVLAYAVAARLRDEGPAPAGVVLVDTFEPDLTQQGPLFAWAMGEILDRDPDGAVVSDAAVLPMGAYLRLISEWEPDAPGVPTLLLQAGSRPSWVGARPWHLTDIVVPVAADHFSILEEDADVTARAVQEWLADRDLGAGACPPRPRSAQ